MQKILSFTLAVIIFICVVVVGTGYIVSGKYSGEYNFVVDENQGVVWNILNDVEKYSLGKRDVANVEVLDRYNDLYAWKETLENDDYKKYRQIEKVDGQKLVVELVESSNGMTGTWEFNLYPLDHQTQISIKEKSFEKSIIKSGILYYIGRDIETKKWAKFVRLRVFGRLIYN